MISKNQILWFSVLLQKKPIGFMNMFIRIPLTVYSLDLYNMLCHVKIKHEQYITNTESNPPNLPSEDEYENSKIWMDTLII